MTDAVLLYECDPNFVFQNRTLTCNEQFPGDYVNYASYWLVFRASHTVHYLAMALFGQLITLSSCFSFRRKNLAPNYCHSRPALPRFGDLVLGTRNRINWVCLHVIMCETIFLILFSLRDLTMPYLGFDWYSFYGNTSFVPRLIVFRIAAIVFYFFFFGPLFIAVAHSSLFNQIVAWMWMSYYRMSYY